MTQNRTHSLRAETWKFTSKVRCMSYMSPKRCTSITPKCGGTDKIRKAQNLLVLANPFSRIFLVFSEQSFGTPWWSLWVLWCYDPSGWNLQIMLQQVVGWAILTLLPHPVFQKSDKFSNLAAMRPWFCKLLSCWGHICPGKGNKHAYSAPPAKSVTWRGRV